MIILRCNNILGIAFGENHILITHCDFGVTVKRTRIPINDKIYLFIPSFGPLGIFRYTDKWIRINAHLSNFKLDTMFIRLESILC